jgi:hypothetical protein
MDQYSNVGCQAQWFIFIIKLYRSGKSGLSPALKNSTHAVPRQTNARSSENRFSAKVEQRLESLRA